MPLSRRERKAAEAARRARTAKPVPGKVGPIVIASDTLGIRPISTQGIEKPHSVVVQTASQPVLPSIARIFRHVVGSFSTLLKIAIGIVGLIGGLGGIYQLRPLPMCTVPRMVKPAENPLYVDFAITNQGHMAMVDVDVNCLPSKTVYSNGETISAKKTESLLPVYSNPQIDSTDSFTARYAPLFRMTAPNDSRYPHDRIIVIGREEKCIFHYLHGTEHGTIVQECPIAVSTNGDPTEPVVIRSDVHLDISYHWKWLPLYRFTKTLRFLVFRNSDSTYDWQPMAPGDPELDDGDSQFKFCLDCDLAHKN